MVVSPEIVLFRDEAEVRRKLGLPSLFLPLGTLEFLRLFASIAAGSKKFIPPIYS